jgi:rubrerythrin
VNLHTASEVISFAKKLESDSAGFYDILSQKYAQGSDVFPSLAKENGKNVVQIERSYYGVITDAIEGCFAFDVEPDAYTFETELAENASYADALDKAIEIEKKMIKFYSDAAEQSQSLLADVPRVFKMIAKKRGNRVGELSSLLKR